MAKNTAAQNPRNKVGRYSGAGEAGISEIVPTDAESRRGLRPMSTSEARWGGGLALGLGALALIGAGLATLLAQRARKPKGLRPRLERMVGLK
jgi:hypothetical protein